MIEDGLCRLGYPQEQIERILGVSRLAPFHNWMYGQTQAICDGRRYNHETKQYEDTECGQPHGIVTYEWDFRRYLQGGEVID